MIELILVISNLIQLIIYMYTQLIPLEHLGRFCLHQKGRSKPRAAREKRPASAGPRDRHAGGGLSCHGGGTGGSQVCAYEIL